LKGTEGFRLVRQSVIGGHISMSENEKEMREKELETEEKNVEIPAILEEIIIEELAVDGICGIY
jgi:mycofactocin precursor